MKVLNDIGELTVTLTVMERDTVRKYLRLALNKLVDRQETEDDPDAWDELDIDIGQLNDAMEKLAG